MVGEKDLRVYSLRGFGGLLRRHGVGLVAGQEGHVDVLDILHLVDVFGIAGDVDPQSVDGEDVAVVAALGVELLPALGRVVGGNGLDFDLFANCLSFAVGKRRASAVELLDRGVQVDLCPLFLEGVYGVLVIVVEVLVGDEDQVRLGEFRVVGRRIHFLAYRVDMDLFSVVLNAHGGVLDGGDGDVFATLGLEDVGLRLSRAANDRSQHNNASYYQVFHFSSLFM